MDAPALEAALRLLARRPLSEHELRVRLERRGFPVAQLDAALGYLRQAGYVDDAKLAREALNLAVGRRRQGRGRAIATLVRRGIDARIAERAWDEALEHDGLAPAAGLRGRIADALARGPLDERAARRLYNALVRAGYDPAEVEGQLAPHLVARDVEPAREDP